MKTQDDILDFKDYNQWRDWLRENHATATEAWIIITKKKYEAQGLGLNAAVEQALCLGDSTAPGSMNACVAPAHN